eukprot:TRINITY_DN3200_c0_g1_i1.p1 TRINITY_DN3200_c0_g1~~TRINITY_DN3200_c0_g1_i1.p1  ORF type:complete len:573 (-),score=175.65 TRINITY_DN3200_c0_g1_i1:254-1852(-)
MKIRLLEDKLQEALAIRESEDLHREDVHRLKRTIEAKDLLIAESRSKSDTMRQHMHEVEQENINLKSVVDSMRPMRQQKIAAVKQLELERDALVEELSRFEELRRNGTQKIMYLENSLAESIREKEKLTQELQYYENLKLSLSDYDELKKQLVSCEDLRNLEVQKVRNLEESLADSEQQVNLKREEVKKLKLKMSDFQEQIISFEGQIEKMEQHGSSLRREFEERLHCLRMTIEKQDVQIQKYQEREFQHQVEKRELEAQICSNNCRHRNEEAEEGKVLPAANFFDGNCEVHSSTSSVAPPGFEDERLRDELQSIREELNILVLGSKSCGKTSFLKTLQVCMSTSSSVVARTPPIVEISGYFLRKMKLKGTKITLWEWERPERNVSLYRLVEGLPALRYSKSAVVGETDRDGEEEELLPEWNAAIVLVDYQSFNQSLLEMRNTVGELQRNSIDVVIGMSKYDSSGIQDLARIFDHDETHEARRSAFEATGESVPMSQIVPVMSYLDFGRKVWIERLSLLCLSIAVDCSTNSN